jgi:hypothetical protein
MTDFFKSALGGMFGQSQTQTQPSQNQQQFQNNVSLNTAKFFQTNEFVGQAIMIGSFKLRIKQLLAEGYFLYDSNSVFF